MCIRDSYSIEDGVVEILTDDPYAVHDVSGALEKLGYTIESSEPSYIPSTTVALDDEDSRKKMSLLLEHLEDNDDVQAVWHNWENPDEDDEEE